MDLKDSITLGEGRGNALIVFLKRGRKEIALGAGTPERIRDLQRKLYRKGKQESGGVKLRKPPEEDNRKAVFGKTERTVVCPEKAGRFSRS